MQLEIQTKSKVLASFLRDDKNKPEGVSIKLIPSPYEKRDFTIQEIVITFLITVSGTVSGTLIAHWLIENIKKYDQDTKIYYKRKEIEISEGSITRVIEENIKIDKTR